MFTLYYQTGEIEYLLELCNVSRDVLQSDGVLDEETVRLTLDARSVYENSGIRSEP